jgi:hypothetical protein
MRDLVLPCFLLLTLAWADEPTIRYLGREPGYNAGADRSCGDHG